MGVLHRLSAEARLRSCRDQAVSIDIALQRFCVDCPLPAASGATKRVHVARRWHVKNRDTHLFAFWKIERFQGLYHAALHPSADSSSHRISPSLVTGSDIGTHRSSVGEWGDLSNGVGDTASAGSVKLRGKISLECLLPTASAELVTFLLGLSLGAPIGTTAMLGAGMLGLFGSVCHDDCLRLCEEAKPPQIIFGP